MEDAAISQLDIGNGNSIFAVFDGHGGKAVSKYLKENLPQFFVNKFTKDIYLYIKSITFLTK